MDADHELCCCSLSLDGFAFSARSAADHAEATHRLRTSFLFLPSSPETDLIVVDIRAALWQAGTGRAPGVIDVALAATAVHAGATVLHYDSDFDDITAAYPRLMSQWVSRGLAEANAAIVERLSDRRSSRSSRERCPR